jgi:carbon storage regulator CsrA
MPQMARTRLTSLPGQAYDQIAGWCGQGKNPDSPELTGELRRKAMLILSRRQSEGFWIDGRIFVTVVSLGASRVKLGVQAPDNVSVVREELLGTGVYDAAERDRQPRPCTPQGAAD